MMLIGNSNETNIYVTRKFSFVKRNTISLIWDLRFRLRLNIIINNIFTRSEHNHPVIITLFRHCYRLRLNANLADCVSGQLDTISKVKWFCFTAQKFIRTFSQLPEFLIVQRRSRNIRIDLESLIVCSIAKSFSWILQSFDESDKKAFFLLLFFFS